MSGRRYFLDTNAIVQLLSGNHSLLTTVHACTLLTADTQLLKTPGLAAEGYAVM